MNKTDIEYLTHTWNPIVMRCDPVSAGCQNCWHQTRARMLANNPKIPKWQQRAYAGLTAPILLQERLERPLKRIKPAIIGVQFMGDLWHKNIDWPMIDQVFEICHKADWHTYIFLTKRIEAAWYYFNSPVYANSNFSRNNYLSKNIYFGPSIENQKTANERLNLLMQIKADTRIVSVEPVLETINLIRIHPKQFYASGIWFDWVIAGPETGPGKRECKPEWIRNLYEQCQAAGVPFFDKTKHNWLAREFPRNET